MAQATQFQANLEDGTSLQLVGTVVGITGVVLAFSIHGEVRILQEGDAIFYDDTIHVMDHGSISFATQDGKVVLFEEGIQPAFKILQTAELQQLTPLASTDTTEQTVGSPFVYDEMQNTALIGADYDPLLNALSQPSFVLPDFSSLTEVLIKPVDNPLDGFVLPVIGESAVSSAPVINLFTEGADTVKFDDVLAADYTDGTQYNSLGGNDTITLPINNTQANEAGYDITKTFNGGDGDDDIGNGGVVSLLDGGAGNDTLTGSREADTLNGGAGNDTLNGSAGNDTLNGGTGNDTINGSSGADTITAGAGADTITPGSGDDTITSGGADGEVDQFLIVSFGAGADTITNFDANGASNQDRVDLDGYLDGAAGGDDTAARIGKINLTLINGNQDVLLTYTGIAQATFSITFQAPTSTVTGDFQVGNNTGTDNIIVGDCAVC